MSPMAAILKEKPDQPQDGSENFGLASKVIEYGFRYHQSKFQKLVTFWTILVFFDMIPYSYNVCWPEILYTEGYGLFVSTTGE